MNHIAEKKGEHSETVNPAVGSSASSTWFLLLTFPAMLIHAFVAYAHRPFNTTLLLELFFGMVNFAAVVMMYYGISRMAYARRYVLLSILALIAIAAGAVMTRDVTIVSMSAGWAAVLITSVLCGTLVLRQISLPKVFVVALVVLTFFASVQLFPLWSKMMWSAPEVADALISGLKDSLTAAGYTAEQIDKASRQFKSLYAAFVKILPAFSIMAVMFQFTIGFWLFVKWLTRSGSQYLRPVDFVKWKMLLY